MFIWSVLISRRRSNDAVLFLLFKTNSSRDSVSSTEVVCVGKSLEQFFSILDCFSSFFSLMISDRPSSSLISRIFSVLAFMYTY